jgi:hypothetical protein
MEYQTPYPWHFDHQYIWYIGQPAYLLIRNEGVQNAMGFNFKSSLKVSLKINEY